MEVLATYCAYCFQRNEVAARPADPQNKETDRVQQGSDPFYGEISLPVYADRYQRIRPYLYQHPVTVITSQQFGGGGGGGRRAALVRHEWIV